MSNYYIDIPINWTSPKISNSLFEENADLGNLLIDKFKEVTNSEMKITKVQYDEYSEFDVEGMYRVELTEKEYAIVHNAKINFLFYYKWHWSGYRSEFEELLNEKSDEILSKLLNVIPSTLKEHNISCRGKIRKQKYKDSELSSFGTLACGGFADHFHVEESDLYEPINQVLFPEYVNKDYMVVD